MRFANPTQTIRHLLAIRRLILATVLVALPTVSSAQLSTQLQNSPEWPKTDFTRISVSPDSIFSGGPPKDGIPAVDEPAYVSQADADEWLAPTEPVIALDVGGKARAYPIQILMWHEIANDELGGVPVSVTFCPLCNAAMVFDRRVGDKVLDFGTTGRLRKSDMVMYDRQTESWWQQFTGTGIIGEMMDVTLKRVPATIVAWSTFKEAHPEGDVLSKDTGHSRRYGANPYQGYDSLDQPFLFTDPVDPRLPAMEYVLNVSVGDKHKLYPLSRLKGKNVVNDEFAGQRLVVLSTDGMNRSMDGGVISESAKMLSVAAFAADVDGQDLTFEFKDGQIIDDKTGSRWNSLGHAVDGELKGKRLQPTDGGVHFAFAWLAFRPESEIFSAAQ